MSKYEFSRIHPSRIKAKVAREIIGRLGGSDSNITYLEGGPTLCEVEFKREDLYSKLITIYSTHSRDLIEEGHVFAPRYVYTVKNIILDSLTGIVFSINGRLIAESSSWPVSHLQLNPIPKPPASKFLRTVSVENLVLISSNGFYHWLIEDLPLTIYLQGRSKKYTAGLFKDSTSFAHSLFSGQKNLVGLERFVHLERYSFVSRGPDTEWIHPMDISTLRSFFQKSFNPTDKKSKIYISRVQSNRSPDFEKDLIKVLETEGWTILETQKMTLLEQVSQISSATVICGVHGAGLAGMVWMNPGARIIEISPENFIPCFSRLSEICDLKYLRIPYSDYEMKNNSLLFKEIADAISDFVR
jgi:hypothetical protein